MTSTCWTPIISSDCSLLKAGSGFSSSDNGLTRPEGGISSSFGGNPKAGVDFSSLFCPNPKAGPEISSSDSYNIEPESGISSGYSNYNFLWLLLRQAKCTIKFYGSFRAKRNELKNFMVAFEKCGSNYKFLWLFSKNAKRTNTHKIPICCDF